MWKNKERGLGKTGAPGIQPQGGGGVGRDAEDGATKQGREGIREVPTSRSKAFVPYLVLMPLNRSQEDHPNVEPSLVMNGCYRNPPGPAVEWWCLGCILSSNSLIAFDFRG